MQAARRLDDLLELSSECEPLKPESVEADRVGGSMSGGAQKATCSRLVLEGGG
jgi:hypothetical protein